MKKCLVKNCKKNSQKRGKYCSMHQARLRRNNSFILNTISNEERFLSKVQKNDSCWLWKGYLLRGYGRFFLNKKRYTAHQASFILFKGEIKKGLIVCHSCDNPSCVNPDHLWLGSHYDNAQDRMNKGRHFCGKGNKKYSENEILAIKDIFKLNFSLNTLARKFNTTLHKIRHLRIYYA